MRRKPMLLLHHVSCPSRWCCVALLCYYDRLVSAAAIRRQVCRRFGVTVSGMGYKVKMLGGRKALGALGWHQGKLLLCSCLCDLVPKWCKKWKAKAAFRFRGLGTMPWTIMVYILVLIITYFSWTHFHVMFVIKKKQKNNDKECISDWKWWTTRSYLTREHNEQLLCGKEIEPHKQ